MSGLSAQERGDLAESLLPEAAGLAVAVREETAEQIGARLASLERHELEALTVVLAAMVDPDRPLTEALGWVDFDEHGAPARSRPQPVRAVRDIASDKTKACRGHGVDMVAVRRALEGERIELGAYERTAAVELGMVRGLSYDHVAELLGMDRETVARSWERVKARAREAGRPVPQRPAWAAA